MKELNPANISKRRCDMYCIRRKTDGMYATKPSLTTAYSKDIDEICFYPTREAAEKDARGLKRGYEEIVDVNKFSWKVSDKEV